MVNESLVYLSLVSLGAWNNLDEWTSVLCAIFGFELTQTQLFKANYLLPRAKMCMLSIFIIVLPNLFLPPFGALHELYFQVFTVIGVEDDRISCVSCVYMFLLNFIHVSTRTTHISSFGEDNLG